MSAKDKLTVVLGEEYMERLRRHVVHAQRRNPRAKPPITLASVVRDALDNAMQTIVDVYGEPPEDGDTNVRATRIRL